MKGAVFIALNDMIESQYGIESWEKLLAEVQPISKGIYTSTEDYLDTEMNDFVVAIANTLELPTNQVTRIFGDYLFGELNKKYTIFTKLSSNLFDFLFSIENVIHKEVRKLYKDANLPQLDCEIPDENTLIMTYFSERKLCYLAEGLIQGASSYYQQPIEIEHSACMHNGAENCILKVTKIK